MSSERSWPEADQAVEELRRWKSRDGLELVAEYEYPLPLRKPQGGRWVWEPAIIVLKFVGPPKADGKKERKDLLQIHRARVTGKKGGVRDVWKLGLGIWSKLDDDGRIRRAPLYGLRALRKALDQDQQQEKMLHLVEGEKCVDALRHWGLHAVCSLGGTNKAGRADWLPVAEAVLRGWRVMQWPDLDAGGIAYARRVRCEVYMAVWEVLAWLALDAGDAAALEQADPGVQQMLDSAWAAPLRGDSEAALARRLELTRGWLLADEACRMWVEVDVVSYRLGVELPADMWALVTGRKGLQLSSLQDKVGSMFASLCEGTLSDEHKGWDVADLLAGVEPQPFPRLLSNLGEVYGRVHTWSSVMAVLYGEDEVGDSNVGMCVEVLRSASDRALRLESDFYELRRWVDG